MSDRVEPKTAAEALEIWRKSMLDIQNPQSQVTPLSIFADADRVFQLANIEGISVSELVSDSGLLTRLHEDAKAFDDILEPDDDFMETE